MRVPGLRDLIDPVSAEVREHPTRNGAILLIVALLVIIGVVTNSIPILDSVGGYTIKAEFAKVNEVNGRSPVRVKGVDVGIVDRVQAGPDARHASQLTLRITKGGLVVHQDATAQIRWRTVLGGAMYIDLNPGSPDAPKLSGPIPVSRTSDQAEFDDVLRVYNGNTEQQQRSMLKGLSQTLSDAAGTQASIAQLPDLTTVDRGLRPYAGTDPGDLSRLVASTAHTVQRLGASTTQLQALVTGADQTLGALDARRVQLGQALSLSPGTLDSTYVTMNRIRTTLGHLDPLVRHLEPGAKLVRSTSLALAPALDRTRQTLRIAVPLLHSARPTLANLHTVANAGVPLLKGIEPSLTRLNGNILPWLQQRDPDTRMINYEAIGPTLSVLDQADAEYDQSGYRLHLSTLLGSASVIDQSALTAGKGEMTAACRRAATPALLPGCGAVSSFLTDAIFGGGRH